MADASPTDAKNTHQDALAGRPAIPREADMSDHPNELSIENTAVVLIEHQPWVAFGVESIDRGVLINNVAGLARAARVLGVPTVLTTVGAQGSPTAEYVVAQLSAGLVPAPTWATEPAPAR
jgi:hypothetical protein